MATIQAGNDPGPECRGDAGSSKSLSVRSNCCPSFRTWIIPRLDSGRLFGRPRDGWWNQSTHGHVLFNLDFGALLFQFLLDGLGLFLGDAGFHRFGGAFDEVLRLLEAQIG